MAHKDPKKNWELIRSIIYELFGRKMPYVSILILQQENVKEWKQNREMEKHFIWKYKIPKLPLHNIFISP